MDSKTKSRLLYMAKILYEETDAEHYLTTNQLRSAILERYGIESHRQTVPGDIEALRAFGMDIKEYLGTQKRFWVENRTFDPAEIKLLIDAISSAKFITRKKSEDLQQKLLTLVSKPQAEDLIRNVSVERRIKRDNENVYIIIDAVNLAINQKQKISFYYFRYDVKKRPQLRNGGEPFIISPHQLVWNGDYYYMLGVNEDREVRIFRLDRILEQPKILNERSRGLPKGFSICKFLNTNFHMYGTDYQSVTLLCENDVVDAILDRFGKGVKLEPVDNDRFRVEVDTSVNNVFYSWVFGFGGKVRIEGPEAVREEYRRMVNSAI